MISKKKIIILGAGLTGLTAGWKLSEKEYSVEIIEVENVLGGLSTSLKHKEYLVDYGPHKIYTQMPNVLNEIKNLLGDDLLSFPKKSSVRLLEKDFDYPLKIQELILKINPLISFRFGSSYFSTLVKNKFSKKNDKTCEDYIINRFGKTIYNFVFKPLAEKTWGNPKELSSDMAKTRISMPGLIQMIKDILLGNRYKPEISAEIIHYPKKAIMQLSEKMAEIITSKKGKIHLDSRITSINLKKNIFDSVELINKGKKIKIKGDYLISTIPLNSLCKLFNPKLPDEIIQNSKALRFRNLILVYTIINKEKVTNNHWSFFPENKFIFNRLSEQKNSSNFIFPKEKTILTAEIPCDKKEDIWNLPDKDIFEKIIKNYEDINLINREDVDYYFIVKLKDVYPVYDILYKQRLDMILSHLNKIGNFMTIGRQGLFNYNNMDHCIDMAIKAVDFIVEEKPKEEWENLLKYFESYKIVD